MLGHPTESNADVALTPQPDAAGVLVVADVAAEMVVALTPGWSGVERVLAASVVAVACCLSGTSPSHPGYAGAGDRRKQVLEFGYTALVDRSFESLDESCYRLLLSPHFLPHIVEARHSSRRAAQGQRRGCESASL